MLEDGDAGSLCRSCRLTRTRPGDNDPDGLAAFAKAEAAKRRLIFGLLDLELPIGENLRFDLLSSQSGPVITGHDDGVITIDLAESDDARRERRRAELGEPYRTLLGHFRHEIGHYYWPILVERTGELERARSLFGDERLDYEEAIAAPLRARTAARLERSIRQRLRDDAPVGGLGRDVRPLPPHPRHAADGGGVRADR